MKLIRLLVDPLEVRNKRLVEFEPDKGKLEGLIPQSIEFSRLSDIFGVCVWLKCLEIGKGATRRSFYIRAVPEKGQAPDSADETPLCAFSSYLFYGFIDYPGVK